MNDLYKKVLSMEVIHDTTNHHFGSRIKNNHRITYKYYLDCGHVVSRPAREAGSTARLRKMIRCEWCESGEEQE
jgi:hypothetical protein